MITACRRNYIQLVFSGDFESYFYCACAETVRSFCPIYMPNELTLKFMVLNHPAKFGGDDRLRIADRQMDRQTDTQLPVLYLMHAILRSIAMQKKNNIRPDFKDIF